MTDTITVDFTRSTISERRRREWSAYQPDYGNAPGAAAVPAAYYTSTTADVFFSATANSTDMKYKSDDGIVLQCSASDLNSPQAFGIFVDISNLPRSGSIEIGVSYDWLAVRRKMNVLQWVIYTVRRWLGGSPEFDGPSLRPYKYRAAVVVVATTVNVTGAALTAGSPANPLKVAQASCQIAYNNLPTGSFHEGIRLNGAKRYIDKPGGAFVDLPWTPMKSMNQSPVFGATYPSGENPPSSLASDPFSLAMRIETPNRAALRLWQGGTWEFDQTLNPSVPQLDTSKFQATQFNDDLDQVRYAGVTVNLADPDVDIPSPMDTRKNLGPVSVRIRKLVVTCQAKNVQ